MANVIRQPNKDIPMDLSNLSNTEIKELAAQSDDKDLLRTIATFVDVTFSGNSGMNTLKDKIAERMFVLIEEEEAEAAALAETEAEELIDNSEVNDEITKALNAHIAAEKDKIGDEDVHVEQVKQIYSVEDMMEMDAAQVRDPKLRRRVVRAQALRLRRVRITNMDPNDSSVPATFVTCYSKYTGKIAKLIPHDSEFYVNGYHIPQIIYDELQTRTYNMRKEVRNKGASFGVKEYKNSVQKKFMIEDLKPLSKAELANLSASQQGRGAVDHTQ
ncbi:hypothetical protein SUFG_00014 [Sulfitobacter phage phiCB2047-B]|uniref:Uncharacterized protein n=1 Tax=Sulfitobacter phage phiCB2047-B TaxID=754046 RepID=M4PRL6_9CAUD|nr:hypothetical protein SUFG_00014 [Sulfitobacter phage phiCB2047-B]AGH07386.1 hypothetical protein SUFG_00014 [Sulfitobacter phage phiCB2047-B]